MSTKAAFSPHLRRCRNGVFTFDPQWEPAGRSMDYYGEYNEAGLALFRQFLGPGAQVAEIGAGFGAMTIPFAAMVGDTGRVYAFEARRALFHQLAANVALNGMMNIDVVRAMVGDKGQVGPTALWDYSGERTGETEQIAVLPVDSMPFAAIHLAVIDAGLGTPAVLRGARDTFAKHRTVLYVSARSAAAAESAALMMEAGYRLWRHEKPIFQPDNHEKRKRDVFKGRTLVNILAVPSGMDAQIGGLEPVSDPETFRIQESP